jgi:hypothetical protein
MEAADPFEKMLNMCRTTRCHITVDNDLHNHLHDNLVSHIDMLVFSACLLSLLIRADIAFAIIIRLYMIRLSM